MDRLTPEQRTLLTLAAGIAAQELDAAQGRFIAKLISKRRGKSTQDMTPEIARHALRSPGGRARWPGTRGEGRGRPLLARAPPASFGQLRRADARPAARSGDTRR